MKKYISAVLILIIFITLFPLQTSAYSAVSMVLIEKESAAVLIDKDCNKKLPMASTTKIMTAVVTLENAKLDAKVKIPREAVGIEGSSMYLVAGETLTVKELLYGLMLTSGNDAATTLALYVGKGSQAAFVELMNKKASELGLQSTNFTNPSGLPDDEHYTTAYELALITSYALSNTTFSEIVSTRNVKIPYKNNPDGRTLRNHNKLLNLYEYTVGVKTGFTKKAGRCLVGAATKDGVTLICVTLNDGDDWNDHINAFEYGFTRVKYTCLAQKNSISVTLQTPDGTLVTAKNHDDVYGVVVDDTPVTQIIKAESFVYAPKVAGDRVGTVEFKLDAGRTLCTDLYLTESIEAPPVKKQLLITRIINSIKNLFKK